MINVGNLRSLNVRLISPTFEGVQHLVDVVQNMDATIRDGVLGRFTANVITRGKENLRDQTERLGGSAATGSTGRLARTIREITSNGDEVRIAYGGGLKYGRLHDKPLGGYHTIVTVNAPRLVFPNRRSPITPKPLIFAKVTHRPTSGYMSDAVKDTKREIPKYIEEEVKLADRDFEESPFVLTSRGGLVQRFGSWGIEGAISRGLVSRSPTNRRDLLLTDAGAEYVRKRRSSRRRKH